VEGILLIKNIAIAHPERVQLLYRKYAITAEVTPQTIALAIAAHGQPFVNDLAKIAAQSRSFLRLEGNTAIEKNWFQKFADSFKEISDMITAGGDVWENISHLFGVDQKLSAKDQAAINLELYRYKAENDRIAANQRTMLYAIVGIAIFGIIAVILIRKS
jgi:hypothetical protein